MKLSDMVARPPLEPWAEGEKIPWHDPEFSRRMLREHLSQEHDLASRRAATIDRQVEWIHRELLDAAPSRILDLACGPGLYTSRLARLGHRCVGIDFSPASIDHARSEARRGELRCEYRLQDLREGRFGANFQLALLAYGELNVFRPGEAAEIMANACNALLPGGLLVLEVHTEQEVGDMGRRAPSWYAVQSGLFSDRPHICLRESRWHAGQRAAVERYLIIDAATAEVTRHAATTQAYTDEEYRDALVEAGFLASGGNAGKPSGGPSRCHS
jgi:SAM-dependent methyltransferase